MTAKRRKNSVSCETILWLLERTSRCSINSWKKVSTLKTKFQIEICASKTTTQETVDHQHPLNDWTLKNVYIDFWLCMQSCLICVMPFFPWGEICFNEYISPTFFTQKTIGGVGGVVGCTVFENHQKMSYCGKDDFFPSNL